MQLNMLPDGEEFIFNHRRYRRIKKIPYHTDVFDCMDDEGRHRPFKGATEVEPCQKRIDNAIIFDKED